MQSNDLAGTEVVIRENGSRYLGSDGTSGWVWQAGRVLAAQLLASVDVGGLRILELGSGTGWLALTLARAGAFVTATERPGALALLTRNVYGHLDRVVADEATCARISVEVERCEWKDNAKVAGDFDIVVGSDLFYIVESYPLLLNALLLNNCKRCILTWEERIPLEEATFLVLAAAAGFAFDPPKQVGKNEVTNNRFWYLDMSFGRID